MVQRGSNQEGGGFSRLLQRKIDLARAALGLERVWPSLVLLAAVAAAFVALSWLGYFTFAPRWARIAVGIGFAAAGFFALLMLARWRLPAVEEGAHRLDLSDPALHRPVSALHDRAAGDDPVSAALWRRHQERARQAAAALKVPRPSSRAPVLDRFAIRALALLLLVAAGFVAGDERMSRLTGALSWGEAKPPATPPRLDAWIDPPAYTGRAPIFLSGANAGSGPFSVPVGSMAVIRVAPADSVSVQLSGSIKPRAEEAPAVAAGPVAEPKDAAKAKTFEQRLIVSGNGTIEVKAAGVPAGRFDIKSIPDLPPKVEFSDIETEDRGQTLKLRYRLEDDYGIAKTEAVITRAGGGTGRALVPPPDLSLGGRLGENESALATQEHPWAGIRVSIRLRATDDVGQMAESEAKEAVLPARRFENAVSKALVEQRRNLVLEPDNRRRILTALDGLLVAPDRFLKSSGDYLLISIALRKLRDARNDADLIALAQYLWEAAVSLDEGLLSNAERQLRAAEERLREALERGASPDEVSRLMDELRQAMNEFLREFAERNRDNADRNERSDQNRTLSQRDLNDMLKQIEEMYRKGDTAQAQELLRQLQEMMRNLRSAERQQGDPRMREMGEALDELERMLRDQENLRDETFRDNQRRRERAQRPQRGQPQQGQRQPGQRGQQGEPGDEGDDGEEGEGQDGQNGQPQQGEGRSLAERQQALRDRLNQLRERLRRQGAGEQEGFDGAEEGMGEAEQNLKRRQSGRATQGQQQAIDELGKAGRGLSQQMQQEMGDGSEQGEGQEGFGPGNPNPNDRRGRANSQNTDPLGRPLPNRGDQMDNSRVKIPPGGDIIGTGERARRVLEELRRRFGETVRPREELDYIERLLPRN